MKKVLLVALPVTLSLSFLAGCGPLFSNFNETQEQTQDENQEKDIEMEANQGSKTKEEVEINYTEKEFEGVSYKAPDFFTEMEYDSGMGLPEEMYLFNVSSFFHIAMEPLQIDIPLETYVELSFANAEIEDYDVTYPVRNGIEWAGVSYAEDGIKVHQWMTIQGDKVYVATLMTLADKEEDSLEIFRSIIDSMKFW